MYFIPSNQGDQITRQQNDYNVMDLQYTGREDKKPSIFALSNPCSVYVCKLNLSK